MNTPQTWAQIGFEVEITGDQSPSLRLSNGQIKGESMHHSGGAAEETELIYGRVIRRCFQQISGPHFISVGLGLGYVEMTVAREALLKKDFNFSLESFELVSELRDLLISWLKGEPLALEIKTVYDQVLGFVLKESPHIPTEAMKDLLRQKLDKNQWQIKGPLESQFDFMTKAHGILFDAFSAKTTPVLWTEEFLVEFFNKATAADSLISTYASRTSLKNALKNANFLVEVREGFKSKRNSTLGLKGLFQLPSNVTSEAISHSTSEPLAGTSSRTQ